MLLAPTSLTLPTLTRPSILRSLPTSASCPQNGMPQSFQLRLILIQRVMEGVDRMAVPSDPQCAAFAIFRPKPRK